MTVFFIFPGIATLLTDRKLLLKTVLMLSEDVLFQQCVLESFNRNFQGDFQVIPQCIFPLIECGVIIHNAHKVLLKDLPTDIQCIVNTFNRKSSICIPHHIIDMSVDSS